MSVDEQVVQLQSGETISYDKALSTIPLDVLLGMVGRPDMADGLRHSHSHIVGVGIRGEVPLGKKCWLYFPESNCPFYRATVFSNYARANCPPDDKQLPTLCRRVPCTSLSLSLKFKSHLSLAHDVLLSGDGEAFTDGRQGEMKGGPWWSLMFEVSESEYKPVDQVGFFFLCC